MKTEILAGKDRLTDFTWHHHQELGRMELIPDWIHEKARHTGGDTLWPRNPSMKGKQNEFQTYCYGWVSRSCQ